jgi:alkaline phosphatase
MTRSALGLLTGPPREKGFFLQVEGASIDKAAHEANPCIQIGETMGFDDAVGVAVDYAGDHPDTLVIVTADHGQAGQIIADGSVSPGSTATVITADGAPMTINYATAGATRAQQHTGTQVRVAARGPQAANVVGVHDQTEVFGIVRRALGLG